MRSWTVYLLECSGGTLYCGATNNMARRMAQHQNGAAAKYTRGRNPVFLTARGELTKSAALRLEAFVKRQRSNDKVHTLIYHEL